MSKKLAVLCITLMLASTSFAADVVIGNWEGSTNEGWADHPYLESHGWSGGQIDIPDLMPSRYQFSDEWQSNGEKSLKANVTGWSWFERNYIHDYFMDHSKIEFDVFAVAQDGSSATYAQVENLAFSGKTNGWFQAAGGLFSFGLGGTGTHCVYDYSAFKTSTYFNAGDYLSVIFAYNADAPVWLYIDNIKMTGVPEPATMGLLGLGGLALLRRRK